jgi:hypothetical protein
MRFLFVGLGILLLLPGTGFAQEKTQAARYKDPEYHYSFDIPAGWQQNTDNARPLVVFTAPRAIDFTINVNITTETVGNATLSQYIKGAKARFVKVNKEQNVSSPTQNNSKASNGKVDIVQIYEEKAGKLGGLPAYTWRLHLNLPGKPAVEERQVCCLRDKRAFVVTFTTLKPDMKKNEAVFDRLLASFKWEK